MLRNSFDVLTRDGSLAFKCLVLFLIFSQILQSQRTNYPFEKRKNVFTSIWLSCYSDYFIFFYNFSNYFWELTGRKEFVLSVSFFLVVEKLIWLSKIISIFCVFRLFIKKRKDLKVQCTYILYYGWLISFGLCDF